MDSPAELTGPVNIGNPSEFTILELAEMAIRQIGSKSEIIRLPLPADDPKQRQPNIPLAREKLGWEPTVPLEQGLARTIEYFRRFV
ncbi:hypothetical protein [Escherichia coli]|uniref:hypothetical protein n=1 Tax=Escherichia coli TaxID=562 RepID=UPI001930F4B7|nr:hypothetical protein [Escherichia coli]